MGATTPRRAAVGGGGSLRPHSSPPMLPLLPPPPDQPMRAYPTPGVNVATPVASGTLAASAADVAADPTGSLVGRLPSLSAGGAPPKMPHLPGRGGRRRWRRRCLAPHLACVGRRQQRWPPADRRCCRPVESVDGVRSRTAVGTVRRPFRFRRRRRGGVGRAPGAAWGCGRGRPPEDAAGANVPPPTSTTATTAQTTTRWQQQRRRPNHHRVAAAAAAPAAGRCRRGVLPPTLVDGRHHHWTSLPRLTWRR